MSIVQLPEPEGGQRLPVEPRRVAAGLRLQGLSLGRGGPARPDNQHHSLRLLHSQQVRGIVFPSSDLVSKGKIRVPEIVTESGL